jgi:4-hydroxybenzoate polyprenyltransferase
VHKRTALSPLVMGLCRLLCYFVAAAMAGGDPEAPILWIGAGGLFCHVVGLTFAARQEAFDRLESIWPLAILAIPLGVALAFSRGGALSLAFAFALAGAAAFGFRLLARRRPGDVSRAVGLLIAAIALYDAALIAGAGATGFALAAALCFPATLILQRTIPGT